MAKLSRHLMSGVLIGATLLLQPPAATAAAAAPTPTLESFIGAEPPLFETPEAALEAFKAAAQKADVAAWAALLGLDPARLAAADGIAERIGDIRGAAAKLVSLTGSGDDRVVVIGPQVWPFPFPLVRSATDGKWAFDTVAGIEEIVNRRVGENELHAIETARLYIEAQRDYASTDLDEDGVLEYAQKIVSSPGQRDGLYWPPEQGDGESPVGPNLDPAAMDKAQAGDGYFGYRFRVLTRQGKHIAGGAYDYVINGNMIGGFALVAWPADYARTGVSTFVISHAGVLYEKDLGPDTPAVVKKLSFNPDKSWRIVPE